jgi:hypothetical protein
MRGGDNRCSQAVSSQGTVPAHLAKPEDEEPKPLLHQTRKAAPTYPSTLRKGNLFKAPLMHEDAREELTETYWETILKLQEPTRWDLFSSWLAQ